MVLLLVFAYMMYFHVKYTFFDGDDISYAARFNSIHSVSDYVSSAITAYLSWSSRVIPETVNMVLVSMPIIIWQILDSLLICLVVHTIVELITTLADFSKLPLYIVISFVMCFMFPLYDMSTAGWVTTSTNNLWNTIAAFYVLMLAIKQYHLNVKLSIWSTIFYLVALVYGSNTELTIVPLVLVLLYINIDNLIHRKISKFLIASLVISLLFFLNALLCPGNAARLSIEMAWFPSFLDFSFCEKLLLGITSTFDRYYNFTDAFWCRDVTIIYLALVCFIWLGCHHLYKSKYIDVLMFIPIALYAFRSDYVFLIDYKAYFNAIDNYSIFKKQYVMPLVWYSVVFATNLTGVFLITKYFWKNNIAILLTLLFFSIFCTRFILSLSPTIYGSSYRTYVFLNIGLIFYCSLFFVLTVKYRFNLFASNDKTLTSSKP